MECRDYHKLIKPYLNEELEYTDCKLLLEHVEECKECKQELKLQFLVREGMDRLSHGGNLNLQGDFEKKIEDTKEYCERMRFHDVIARCSYEVAFIFAFVILIYGYLHVF